MDLCGAAPGHDRRHGRRSPVMVVARRCSAAGQVWGCDLPVRAARLPPPAAAVGPGDGETLRLGGSGSVTELQMLEP